METVGSIFGAIFGHFGTIIALIALVAFVLLYKWTFRLFGIYIIPDDSLGTLTKKFVLFGANRQLPAGKIVALNGEAGYQADTLAPGLHFFLWPWQYDVAISKFTVVPPGQIGVVEACDGAPLPDGRIIAKDVACDNFQDARAFLNNGGQRGVQVGIIPPGAWRINTLLFTVKMAQMTIVGPNQIGVIEARDGVPLSGGRILAKHVDCGMFQDGQAFLNNNGERGPQMTIVPQGQYRINPALFNVDMANVIDVPDEKIGVVTTKEGAPLPTGDIAGSEVEGHNSFQDPMAFVAKGGTKGLQVQVLRAGRYFINPKFAIVEMKDMTEVPIAHVGVVIAFVGKKGEDVTGADFKHGNMVREGERGVWIDVLNPGKYPMNPFAYKVINVPTANVVLNWANSKSESHKLDEKLSTITVRSADGFPLNLDVSQIIHIPTKEAPKVIARFGSMQALVTQVLEPTIGNYFRNAAQSYGCIDFVVGRAERQTEAELAISAALKEYDVVAVRTLIGDLVPPQELMDTLTQRKVAEQQKTTYGVQKDAQEARKLLEQATAQAATQAGVVAAERSVEIAEFNANALVKTARGEADAKTINAKADAEVLTVVGEAEGKKINAVGTAEAAVIQLKTNAVGAGNYASIQIADSLSKAGIKLVPDVMVAGSSEGGHGGTIVDALLGNMLAKGLATVPAVKTADTAAPAEAKS